MTFMEYEKDPNHITFDFIKYYYSKLSLDCSKLYQLYNKDAVIKHSESTKTHDFNTSESIKNYWKSITFLANSKIVILTVNTVENSDKSLVATVVGEIFLEEDGLSSTKDSIIPTRPFTQTFVLVQQEDKDAYMIKSDILTFIPDTDYEKAELIDSFDVELVEDKPLQEQEGETKHSIEKLNEEKFNGNIEKQKVQQEVVEKPVQQIITQEQTTKVMEENIKEDNTAKTPETVLASEASGKSNSPLSSASNSPSLISKSAALGKSSTWTNTAATTATKSQSAPISPPTPTPTAARNNTAEPPALEKPVRSTACAATAASSATKSQSAPTSPPTPTAAKTSTFESPAPEKTTVSGSWASLIKTSTSTTTSPGPGHQSASSSIPTTPKIQTEEPFTTVRSHSQNNNLSSNKKGSNNSKTHPFEVFAQFKNAAVLPKEKDLDEALKKKDFKGFKITVFKLTNAIVGFTTKEEQTRALEIKNILHKDVDYFIDVRNPKPKKKIYNSGEKRY